MYIPELGELLPRRGNCFSKWLGRLLMRLCNWQIEGEICQSPKFVVALGPHTSWWDFTTNLGVLLAIGLHASWFIANKYTKGEVGRLLTFFGAVPVERSERSDLVSQMVREFNNRSQFVLAIFPEGTRRPVDSWKTGFWHIAKQAGVPVQLVGVDYEKRATVFGPIVELSDDKNRDIRTMQLFFQQVTPKHPENARYSE